MQGSYTVAVDIGGTKTAVAAVTDQKEILARQVEATNQNGPEAGIDQIKRMCGDVINAVGEDALQSIGIGIPAVLEHNTDRVIWAPNITGWRNVALRPALEEYFNCLVAIEYDGHTAVLGEWWFVSNLNIHTLVTIIIGTGIGGGIMIDGKLFRGRDRLAGAAGWFPLTTDAASAEQLSGKNGHWELLAAGPGILRRTLEEIDNFPDSVLHQVDPEQLTGSIIFDAARTGDTCAQHIVKQTAHLIGLGISNVVSLLNPDRIVLGGSIGSQGDLLLGDIIATVKQWAQPAAADSVEIVSSELGGDAGILGAAYAANLRMGTR